MWGKVSRQSPKGRGFTLRRCWVPLGNAGATDSQLGKIRKCILVRSGPLPQHCQVTPKLRSQKTLRHQNSLAGEILRVFSIVETSTADLTSPLPFSQYSMTWRLGCGASEALSYIPHRGDLRTQELVTFQLPEAIPHLPYRNLHYPSSGKIN